MCATSVPAKVGLPEHTIFYPAERVVHEGKVEGTELRLRMALTAENAPLNHVVEETSDLR